MAEKLYYKNAYLKDFTTTVVHSEKIEGGYSSVLRETAFFPEEGGQYSDRGIIDGVRVFNVIEKDGEIYHITDLPLEVGKSVECHIDFAERFEKMQCHTAEHILSGLIHSHFGLDNVGFHLGADEVTMDISAPLSAKELLFIEKLANEAVYENVEVKAVYPTPEQLSSLEYRSKLDITENVRIVNIGKYDSCACCAPHVAYTGEIGFIKIIDFAKLRGGIRIRIAAGARAYRYISAMHENLTEISHALSAPKLDAAEAVKKLLSEHESVKGEYKSFRLSAFEAEEEKILPTDGNSVVFLSGASMDEMRAVANKAVAKIGGILAVISDSGDDRKYILASASFDLKSIVKKINAALDGRGGGNSQMAQGSFLASCEKIKDFFEKDFSQP